MSLEERLAVIGPDLTKAGKYFTLLRVVGVIKRSDDIKVRIGLGRRDNLIITSLPLEKDRVYVANIILPRLPGINNSRTGAYLLNIDLGNFEFKEISYDYNRGEYVMKIYKKESIAYVDNRYLMERSLYIVVLIDPHTKIMKLPKEISYNIRKYIN